MAEWIACSERLPEPDTDVLVAVELGICSFLDVGVYRRGAWSLAPNLDECGAHVTHWQPLPPPPEPAAAQEKPCESS